MKTTIRTGTAVAAFFAAASLSAAGTQCRLTGVVTDSNGAPVEGATVTVTTPNLTSFKLTVTTDKNGRYGSVLNDCTMPYHFKYEKEGFVASELDKKIPIGDISTVDTKLTSVSEARAKAAPAAAAQASPGDQAVIAFNDGIDALNAGDKPAAEAKFLEAVRKNQDLQAGWQALTQLAYQKKDAAKVLEYGQKATELDPTQSNIYLMMAEASTQLGDKKGAAEWQAKYEEANPDSPEILYNKGIELYNKGKMKDAETTLQKAVEAKPDFALAHFWLGMAAFNQNKKAPAKEHLEKYLELDPNGKDAATAKEILPLLK